MSTLITIDLGALMANYRHCARQLQPSTCAAVVKADAYGLGIGKIAPALRQAGCRQFFTATHREGIALRELLPGVDIYVFEGVTEDSTTAFIDHKLVPVLITPAHGALWARAARASGKPLPAIFHIDTGMTRLGFGEQEIMQFLESGDDLDWLDIRYLMTHFACAEDPGGGSPDEQLDRFNRLRQLLPAAPTSIGNSAGALLGDKYSGDMARVGIALFGGNPYPDGSPPFQPVLRWQSRILQLRKIRRERPIGYGASYTARPGTVIATVGTGYADGYPWALSNRGIAVIGGHRVPVVGRVSMDLITLDVTAVPADLVQPGSLVDLIGPDISLEEVAELAGTINYEILTQLGRRARREFKGGPAGK
jgi:alanine racemase